MVSVCFYFQVHQPYRLKKYQVFDIGNNHNYFDENKNKEICKRIAEKCYLPANRMLLETIRRSKGKFKASFSISGVALEQFEKYSPEVIESFRLLNETGCIEFLNETYYHSLSSVYSKDDFRRQVEKHRAKIKELFGVSTKIFRNTELIFNNELAKDIHAMGFSGILAEGADHILGWRSPNYIYRPASEEKIGILLRNYKLSDDIAFRYSNKNWEEWPLKPEKYAKWINAINGSGDLVNLFMDYETFGEHQWEETGIFDFLKLLPHEILKHKENDFVTCSEAIERYDAKGNVDMHDFVSWADFERDISAWSGNPMQENAIKELYMIEDKVMSSDDPQLIEDWNRLTTSDHFYYMCTKHLEDGDVHGYFNPHDSPYESFIAFMNVLNDMILRVNGERLREKDFSGMKEMSSKTGKK